jgi:rubrerythrin
MIKLLLMLQWAHAVEVGAYEAYEGHWRSLPDGTTGQRTIKAIQIDELRHKEAIEHILESFGSKPNALFDGLVWCVGKTISISCRFMGHRMAMWGAKVMEVMGANLYKKIAKLARNQGYYTMAVNLDWMQNAEEDHQRFITICLEPSKVLDQQSQN